MKVLFTVASYYPQKDGVANVTKYLAEGLVKLGHDVSVITSNHNVKVDDKEVVNGVNIQRINLYTRCGLYYGNKKEYKRMIKDYSDTIDVLINVCTQQAFTDLLLSELNKYKCKKILYKHDIFDFRFNKTNFSNPSTFVNKIWKEILWSSYYFINSKSFKEYDYITELHEKCYGNYFFEKKYNINSIIIGNAADKNFFCSNKKENIKKPFDNYIINVSNYSDNKNQKLAIREFLKSNIDNTIGLVFIGSSINKYYHELENYIRKLRKKFNLKTGEKEILLLHNIDRELIPYYVSNSSLYLMTSKSEKYPMSIVESMAAGIPYICTDVGIVKYFVGGIVSSPNDIHYWIEKIMNNNKLRKQMSDTCKQYAVDNFIVEDKVDILDRLIKE